MAAKPVTGGEGATHHRSPTRGRVLSVLGMLVALWALLPPYLRDIGTESRVEIVDHVVPAVVIAGVSLTAAFAGLGSKNRGTLMFVGGLIVLLAGIWITATHVPLLAQGRRGEVAMGDAWFHTLPGLAVLVLGGAWAAAHWGDAAPPEGGAGRAGD